MNYPPHLIYITYPSKPSILIQKAANLPSSLSESLWRARCLIIPSLSRQSRKSIASCRHLGFALVVRLVSHFAAFVGCYLPGWLY